jgi:hypothetical protein
MVALHDSFDVTLVDASTSIPFPIHEGLDGQFYVEVEPDAEYFVRVKRVRVTDIDVLAFLSVDGREIPGCSVFNYGSVPDNIKDIEDEHLGTYDYHRDGTCTKGSFRFVKPPMVVDPKPLATKSSSSSSEMATDSPSMGNVEVRLFVAGDELPCTTAEESTADEKFSVSAIARAAGGMDKKKHVRSGEGTIKSKIDCGLDYEMGELLASGRWSKVFLIPYECLLTRWVASSSPSCLC